MDAPYYNGDYSHLPGEGPDDERTFECDRCSAITSELFDVEVCRQTHWSPAEYERVCGTCLGPEGPDERDEPTEDELEDRRRGR